MRDTVYFLVFDGYADWQAALALCEIRRPGDWRVQAVGFSTTPVVSMGGLTVQPELSLAQLDLQRAALLILPGGHLWTRGEGSGACRTLVDRAANPPDAVSNPAESCPVQPAQGGDPPKFDPRAVEFSPRSPTSDRLRAAVAAARRVHAAGAPVAGIADGVLALARAGLLDHCRHTANHPGHIGMHVSDYRGAEQYDAAVLAVSDGGTLTASELGSVEFAREVIRTLDLYNAGDREHWFRLYKHAMPPPWLAEGADARVHGRGFDHVPVPGRQFDGASPTAAIHGRTLQDAEITP